MWNFRQAISDFFVGFGPGYLFVYGPRRGRATQIFATDDVPCDPDIQAFVDECFRTNEALQTDEKGPR